MTSTRPDLSFIVNKLSQYLSGPEDQHWVAAKRVLRYLKGTVDLELCYKKNYANLKLVAYSDADLNDRRSVTVLVYVRVGLLFPGSQRNNKLYPHVKPNTWLYQLLHRKACILSM